MLFSLFQLQLHQKKTWYMRCFEMLIYIYLPRSRCHSIIDIAFSYKILHGSLQARPRRLTLLLFWILHRTEVFLWSRFLSPTSATIYTLYSPAGRVRKRTGWRFFVVTFEWPGHIRRHSFSPPSSKTYLIQSKQPPSTISFVINKFGAHPSRRPDYALCICPDNQSDPKHPRAPQESPPNTRHSGQNKTSWMEFKV